tara:strand:- start:3816 stop:4598 length:783 start_codon:yes stop_codon:yes gene_type:complete
MSKVTHLHHQSNILLIGDSCTDVYDYGTCDRISPEAPVPVLKVNRTESLPGMALNVKKCLEALGNQVTLHTNKEKITKNRFVCDRTKQHILRVDRGETKKIKPFVLSRLKKINFETIDGIVLSDYNKGYLTYDTCKSIVDFCRTKCPIFVDTKKKNISCFEGCYVKVNQQEFKEIEKFPNKCEMIVTLGAEGAMYSHKVYPTTQTDVFDVCGAGDTFLSAFASHFLVSFDEIEAVRFANKAASVAVSKFGNYSPKLEEIL